MITWYLILINALGLFIMLVDKQKAKAGAWRIPEATLLTAAVIGGSIGILTGMYVFRHKTRKWKFFIGVPLIFAAQLAAIYFLTHT